MRFTLGTHNLHDEAGVPTFFADVLIYTEAIPATIRARAAQRWAHAKARLAGYVIVVCREQPDLVVAFRRRLFKYKANGYTKYVDGRPKVTPNRGTFTVYVQTREPRGKPVAIDAEHRINAWHPSQPDRGERVFRDGAWHQHTSGTWEKIRRQLDSGYLVLAGGDTNTPGSVNAYPTYMRERGVKLDRLAASVPIGPAQEKSRKGSDHPRLVATVTL